jgi:hypothetical protein
MSDKNLTRLARDLTTRLNAALRQNPALRPARMRPRRTATPTARLLNSHPSLAPTLTRLARIPRPVAGPPRPAEQGLLIPPDPSEGQAPRRASRRGR